MTLAAFLKSQFDLDNHGFESFSDYIKVMVDLVEECEVCGSYRFINNLCECGHS